VGKVLYRAASDVKIWEELK